MWGGGDEATGTVLGVWGPGQLWGCGRVTPLQRVQVPKGCDPPQGAAPRGLCGARAGSVPVCSGESPPLLWAVRGAPGRCGSLWEGGRPGTQRASGPVLEPPRVPSWSLPAVPAVPCSPRLTLSPSLCSRCRPQHGDSGPGAACPAAAGRGAAPAPPAASERVPPGARRAQPAPHPAAARCSTHAARGEAA